MYLCLIILIILIKRSYNLCEDDPLKGWEVLNPMFDGTTSYYITNLNEYIILQCEICGIQEGYWLRQWVKIDFGGLVNKFINVTQSNLDETEERITTNDVGDLRINKIQMLDAGFYICRAIYRHRTPIQSKTVHLIDIVLPHSNETKDISVDMVEEVGKLTQTERCNFEERFALQFYGCTFEWSIWSPCSVCGQNGVRYRTSECRVVYNLQLERKNEEGKIETASMPQYLMSCFSSMIHENSKVKPEIKKHFKTLPVFKAYEECFEECADPEVQGDNKPVQKHKLSFFKRYRQRLRQIKEKFKQRVQDIRLGLNEPDESLIRLSTDIKETRVTTPGLLKTPIPKVSIKFFAAGNLLIVYGVSSVIFFIIIILKFGRAFAKRTRRGSFDEK